PLALDAMVSEKNVKLFVENGVYTPSEIHARHEIELEKYIKKIQIEGRIMGEMATSMILPPAIRYQNLLAKNIKGLKEAGLTEEAYANQKQIIDKISEHINKASDLVEQMIEARKKCNAIEDTREKAIAYEREVKAAFFDKIRYHADKLELLVDDKEWYLPKYRELLFLR